MKSCKLYAQAKFAWHGGIYVLAIGIVWIVLVPSEMLGVSSGLGYFILDARDRLIILESLRLF